MTVMEGVKGFEPHTFKNANGLAYGSKRPILMGPTLLGDNTMDLLVSGDTELKPKEILHYFTTQSPLAYMFEDAKVVETTACILKAWSTIPVPYKGSALLIGDAAAFVEVQVQGALMCGYHAGTAVASELQGKKGFRKYTDWWNRTFEFNSSDFLRVAQGYSLSPTYNDDELDYLFSLTEDEVLEGTLSQYKTPRLMWESILRHQDLIAREKPEIHEKIKALDSMVLN
jgi:flavin-dependent dehydrogenase